jgi:hypothetical protein
VTRRVFVGVDPGFTGAVAFLEDVEGTEYARVHDMPIRKQGEKTRVDRDALRELIKREIAPLMADRVAAVVEAVSTIGGKKNKRGGDRKEGTVSMFRFGQGQGEALGVLSGMGAMVFEIPPPTWKMKCGLVGMNEKEVCKRALELFPYQELFGPGGGAKHGRAEALFLAAYARMLVEGKGIYDR